MKEPVERQMMVIAFVLVAVAALAGAVLLIIVSVA